MTLAYSDYDGADATRQLQADPKVIASNHAMLAQWGAYNLLRVKSHEGANPEPRIFDSGYFTLLPAISGLTPEEMNRTLGLREGIDLVAGALVYRFSRVPSPHEFLVRGYTTLPDGLHLRTGLATDSAGYRPGFGAWQGCLKRDVEMEMTLVATVLPGETFEPGLHPKYR